MENWKPIKGYKAWTINENGDVQFKGQPHAPTFGTSNGYKVVYLPVRKGLYRQAYIHRLVAEAFVDNPHRKKVVDHIDRDILNNHVSNLRWATHSENCANSGARKHNKLGVKNVTQLHGKYLVTVGPYRQTCDTLETAKTLAVQYAQKLWGEYAYETPFKSCGVKYDIQINGETESQSESENQEQEAR